MQKIEKYKSQKLSHFNQLIILNDEGNILDSCNSIFEVGPFQDRPFTQYFPFLESIFPNLLELQIDSPELRFTKIEAPIAALPGIYDFTFTRMSIDGRQVILWSIYDYTNLYEDLRQYQQKRNELEIHRELLESRNRKLKRQQDLLAQKNLVLENWDEVRRDYYEKVRLALQSPINALDGLSFILAKISPETDQDYLQTMQATVQHLQDILKEFELLNNIDRPENNNTLEPFPPRSIIEAVIKDLSNLSRQGQAFQLEVEWLGELPSELRGNSRHLYQILHQLLLNLYDPSTDKALSLQIEAEENSGGGYYLNLRIKAPIPSLSSSINMEESEQHPAAALIFRLSLVRKLIELEGGGIEIAQKGQLDLLELYCQLYYPRV